MQTQLNPTIFKAYDIRGIVGKTVDAETARLIGRAFGSAARAKGESAVVIGRDGRLSGPELLAALADGQRASGVRVLGNVIGDVAVGTALDHLELGTRAPLFGLRGSSRREEDLRRTVCGTRIDPATSV